MRSGSGWRPFPHPYIHGRFRTLSPPPVRATAALGWQPFGGRRRSTPARTELPSRIRRSKRCAGWPCKKCAINGRFCPLDLRLSILRNHWVSHETTNNPFLAQWSRHDSSPFTAYHDILGTTEQKTAQNLQCGERITILGHARVLLRAKIWHRDELATTRQQREPNPAINSGQADLMAFTNRCPPLRQGENGPILPKYRLVLFDEMVHGGAFSLHGVTDIAFGLREDIL